MRALLDQTLARLGSVLRPRDNAFQRREISEMIARTDGCVLCSLTERTVARYLDMLAYEYVNDIPTRDSLRSSRGFCTEHAWQLLEQVRDPMGIGIIYRDVVNDVVKTLERHVSAGGWKRLSAGAEAHNARVLAGRLRPRRSCIACDQARLTDLDNVHAMARYLAEPEFASLYSSSTGVCAWHATRLLAKTRARGVGEVVNETQARWLERVASGPKHGVNGDAMAAALAGTLGARPRRSPIWDSDDRSFATGEPGPIHRPTMLVSPAGRLVDLPVAVETRPLWLSHLECPVCWALLNSSPQPVTEVVSSYADMLCARHTRDSLLYSRQHSHGSLLADGVSVHLVPGDATGASALVPAPGRDGRLETPCPDCVLRVRASSAMIAEAFSSGSHAVLASACLPHLYQVCLVVAPPSARREVIALRSESWRALVDQLLEYIRKLDYRFRSEPRGDEQLAPRLAIPQMVGHDRHG